MEYRQSVAMGKVPGAVPLMVTGSAFSIDNKRVPFMLSEAQLPPKWLTMPTKMEIFSTSANDGIGGIGAKVVEVKLLDGDFAEHIIPVNLTGTTPVALIIDPLFINGAQVTSVGRDEVNVGNITIRTVGTNLIQAYIPAGLNSDRSLRYTVPSGKTFLIENIFNTSMKSSSGDVSIASNLSVRSQNGVVSKLTDNFTQTTDASINVIFPTPLTVKEKTTIFSMIISASNTGANYGVTAFGILMDNTNT